MRRPNVCRVTPADATRFLLLLSCSAASSQVSSPSTYPLHCKREHVSFQPPVPPPDRTLAPPDTQAPFVASRPARLLPPRFPATFLLPFLQRPPHSAYVPVRVSLVSFESPLPQTSALGHSRLGPLLTICMMLPFRSERPLSLLSRSWCDVRSIGQRWRWQCRMRSSFMRGRLGVPSRT